MIKRNEQGKIQKGMLSVKELAAYLHVSETTIYRMVDNNKISYLRIGDTYRFPIHHIEGYVENNLIKKTG